MTTGKRTITVILTLELADDAKRVTKTSFDVAIRAGVKALRGALGMHGYRVTRYKMPWTEAYVINSMPDDWIESTVVQFNKATNDVYLVRR